MYKKLFGHSWQRAWKTLQTKPADETLLAQLLYRYAEPARKYHTQQHLAECLKTFGENASLSECPGEVEIALWFHDAIYDVRAGDNEMQSALWATQTLRQAGLPDSTIEKVRLLILATVHDSVPATADERLLTDIDLAILGAPAKRFDEYERQIRAEYAWVAEDAFNSGRTAILEKFLARPTIYGTRHFQDRLESRAQENLRAAVTRLNAQTTGNAPAQEG